MSLTGACGFRILWIFTIFAWNRNLTVLYMSYPISWVITTLMHFVTYIIVKRRLDKKAKAEVLETAAEV